MDKINSQNTTVVICCAGMGTRLGIGTTKALVDVDGTPLIIRQLELLKRFDDVRVVVGFQAERLIQVVKEYRKDIVFAFNYQYESTGVADSLKKGLLSAREYVISLDGDILVNQEDFSSFVEFQTECIAVTKINSEEPVLATVEDNKVIKLSKNFGNMQWPGLVKINSKKIMGQSSHVYDLLNNCMPFPAFYVRAREIDTQLDYDNAMEWFEAGCKD